MEEINYALDSNPNFEVEQPQVEEPSQEVTDTPDLTPNEPEGNTEPNVEPTPNVPTEIEIEGLGKVSIDELKRGYMRQGDYTRKTQEVAKQRKEVEHAMNIYQHAEKNPQLLQQLKQNLPNDLRREVEMQTNPILKEIEDLKVQLAEKELNDSISRLKQQYADFDEVKVLNEAYERGITDLEFVYKATKSEQTFDMEAMKNELRQQILQEIQQNKETTSTIVKSTGVVKTDTVKLSPQEESIAKALGLTTEEYAKWK